MPLPDSTVPIPASTVHGSPGHVAAARSYRRSIPAGIAAVAVADGVTSPPPSSAAAPAPATSTTISTSPAAAIPAARTPLTGTRPGTALCRPHQPPAPAATRAFRPRSA